MRTLWLRFTDGQTFGVPYDAWQQARHPTFDAFVENFRTGWSTPVSQLAMTEHETVTPTPFDWVALEAA